MHIVKTDVQKHVSIRATPDCVQLQVHIFIRVQFIVPFMVPVRPGLNVCWLIKDRLRRGYKAQLLPST